LKTSRRSIGEIAGELGRRQFGAATGAAAAFRRQTDRE